MTRLFVQNRDTAQGGREGACGVMYTVLTRGLGELSPQEYLAVPDHYKQHRRCVLCDATFCELGNIGLLHCRLHPGELRYSYECDCYTYSCCDRLADEAGCTPCDHMDAFLSDALPQRWLDLKAWMLAALPLGLFWFGVRLPHDENVLLDARTNTSLTRDLTLSITLADYKRGPQREQITLDSVSWSQRIIAQTSSSVLLSSLLAEKKNERQRRKESAVNSIASQRQRRLPGLQTEGVRDADEDATVTRLPQFIPFVVVRRVAL